MPQIYNDRRPGASLWDDMANQIRRDHPMPEPLRTTVAPLWVGAPLTPIFLGISFLSLLRADYTGTIIFALLAFVALAIAYIWVNGYGLRASMEKRQTEDARNAWEHEVNVRAANLQAIARKGWVSRKDSPEGEQATTFANGAAAEERVGMMFEKYAPDNWEIAHDVAIVDEQGVRANIDHLICTPQGVFVVDAKAWTGHLVVRNGALASGLIYKDGRVSFIDRSHAADTVAWEATHVGVPVTSIIALDVGTAEEEVQQSLTRSGRVLAMPVESVITFIQSLPGGNHLPYTMNRVDAASPALRF